MNIHIPQAALDAGARAVIQYRNSAMSEAGIARAAFLAMVEAWPGMYRADWNDKNELDPVIILPLPPQENSDE